MKTRIPLVPTLPLMIATLLVALVVVRVAFALDSDAARFEAETLSEASVGIASVDDGGTQAERFSVVGEWASETVNFSHSAEQLEIRMRSTAAGGLGPSLRVFVDGNRFSKSVLTQIPAGTYTTYAAPVNLSAGSHTVLIKCIQASGTPENDGDCTSDRQGFVDWVAFTYTADADGDGVADSSDNCPDVSNPSQADLDGDGQGDACDSQDNRDTDSDGVQNYQDNCPDVSNPQQADLDGDGQGNACDGDIDGDGRPNETDHDPYDPGVQDAPNDCDIVVKPGTGTIPVSPAAGSVVCLRGGVYQHSATRSANELLITSDNVTYKSYPGELAELRMGVQIAGSATGVVVGDSRAQWPEGNGLDIKLHFGPRKDASYGQCPLGCDAFATQSFHWAGDGGGIYANKITNRDPSLNTYDAGICVFMSGSSNPVGVTVDGNYLYSCGQLPRDNHEHAIYANGMTGGAITDNLIYDSADRQIQMYQHPSDVTISGNLVAQGNQAGINTNEDASNIDIFNNVVVLNDDKNYYSGTNPIGGGHILTDNCTWMTDGTSGVQYDPSKVTASGNVTAAPQLQANWDTGVVKVMNPACAAKLPPGSRFLP